MKNAKIKLDPPPPVGVATPEEAEDRRAGGVHVNWLEARTCGGVAGAFPGAGEQLQGQPKKKNTEEATRAVIPRDAMILMVRTHPTPLFLSLVQSRLALCPP